MDLNDMVMFAHVAREQSFSKAARKLSLSISTLSKAVSRLEASLGTRLLYRTTRRISLTEVGTSCYARCTRILEEIEGVEEAVSLLSDEPAGILRVTAPVSFGVLHLGSVFDELLSRYPKLQVDVQLHNELTDLIQGSFDVAIRITTTLPDSSFMMRHLITDRWAVAASPSYYERHGRPCDPDELLSHRCLIYSPRGNKWGFSGPTEERTVQVSGPFASNNAFVLQTAALRGMGLVMLPEFILGHMLEAGALEAVLTEFSTPARSIYALSPQTQKPAPKVRVFVDLLVEHFRDNRWRAASGLTPLAHPEGMAAKPAAKDRGASKP